MGHASVTSGIGVILTTLLGSTLFGEKPAKIEEIQLPSHSVNMDNALLSSWISETLDSESEIPLDRECDFFNFSRSFSADFCDVFTLSRVTKSTIDIATRRAAKCAAKTGAECVLSGEIGLAIPAAFIINNNVDDGIMVVLAPKNMTLPVDEVAMKKHVRINDPDDSFSTKVVFDDKTRVEFLTPARAVESRVFHGNDAFCLQLLRASYEPACWWKLQ